MLNISQAQRGICALIMKRHAEDCQAVDNRKQQQKGDTPDIKPNHARNTANEVKKREDVTTTPHNDYSPRIHIPHCPRVSVGRSTSAGLWPIRMVTIHYGATLRSDTRSTGSLPRPAHSESSWRSAFPLSTAPPFSHPRCLQCAPRYDEDMAPEPCGVLHGRARTEGDTV